MPIAVEVTGTSTPQKELNEARQKYQSARARFDNVIDALATIKDDSDDEIRAIHEALSALTEAELQFHSALRAYAESVRHRARAV